jgi:hypothetical protein
MIGSIIILGAGLAWILYYEPQWLTNHWYHWLKWW